jgi:translation initiation factor 1A
MVKNLTGGNKTKGNARKFSGKGRSSASLRLAHDENEIYAKVIKVLGNGMLHVLCLDGKTRLCHIRGKFSGRGKRDNTIYLNSWLLVGLRDWVTKVNSKIEDCDLLEVYQETDKETLMNNVSGSWTIFQKNETVEKDNTFTFADEREIEYEELLTNTLKEKTLKTVIEEEININDI